MSKFNSTRNKIFKIWKEQESDNYTISLQSNIKEYIKNSIKKVNVINSMSSVPQEVEFDFELLIPWYKIDGEVYESYKSWRIVFDSFPEEYISGITPIIIKKYGVDSTGSLEDSADVKENYVFGIEDIAGDSAFKRVTLDVGIVYDDSPVQDDIYVKLLIFIFLPNIII